MTENAPAAPLAPTAPSFDDQVAAVATLIARGARAAIGASTIELVAVARHLIALQNVADLTFDMLSSADRLLETKDPDLRRAMQRQVRQKISVVGASLEALGYGANP